MMMLMTVCEGSNRVTERPLTHYKKKCGYFLVNFLRNIGIQQTHTIHKALSLTHFKKNLTLFSLKQNATCFYFFLPLLCVFFHGCREVYFNSKKRSGLLYFLFILIRCCWSLIGRFFPLHRTTFAFDLRNMDAFKFGIFCVFDESYYG